MAKFHISKNGDPGVCSAKYTCPLGGADEHYETQDEARNAYETKMTSELLPEGFSGGSIPLRSLTALAKITSDEAIINDILDTGSNQSLKNLAKNPNVTGEQLHTAYGLANAFSGGDATKAALALHPNYPADKMTPEELVSAGGSRDAYKRDESVWKQNSVSDEHLELADSMKVKVPMNTVLENPHNKLSQERFIVEAEKSFISIGYALKSGRYPTDKIKTLPENLVYWANVDSETSVDRLDAYADWTLESAPDTYKAKYVADRIANNPATPSATLHKLVENNLVSVKALKHPNASEATKKLAASKDPEVGRVIKLEELEKRYPQGLRQELSVTDNSSRPFGANRGYTVTRVQFDTAKVKALNLDADDINTLMGTTSYNGGRGYDAKTGIFEASNDSTD